MQTPYIATAELLLLHVAISVPMRSENGAAGYQRQMSMPGGCILIRLEIFLE